MTSHTKNHPARVLGLLAAVIFMVCAFATVATAQDQPPPKWEVYGGYSLFYPGAVVYGKLPGALQPVSSQIETNPRGLGGSVTYNFTRYFGFTVDASDHWKSGETTVQKTIDDAGFFNLSAGPKFTYRRAHFAPFVEAMIGWHRLDSDLFGTSNKVGIIAGGGLDIPFTRHFALRLIRVDFVAANHRYGISGTVPATNVRGARAQTGLVFSFGDRDQLLPASATCSATPADVTAGEPVTATVTPANFDPNHTLTYNWSGTGGKVSGTGATGTVDTTGLAPGSYTVVARVNDAKRKNNGEATCNSSFNVKELPKNPPTISCSPNPSTVQVGGTSIITSNAKSPDGRPLTYSYTSTAGTISGTTETANLNTGGASGTITVTCNTQDDRGLSASNTTAVNVEAPPPPALVAPEASKLNQIDFKKKSPRVDNAAKAILDDVALRMQRDSDARLVLVGESASDEPMGTRLAAQRGFNTKAYLVNEKGIDANRIDVRTGNSGNMQTEIWLVPAGATFNNEGTMVATEPATRPSRKKK